MNDVKTYESVLTLPGCPPPVDDREPALLKELTPRGAPIYPYSTQEVLGNGDAPRDFKSVVMENDFIRLTFLPELNGRLYSAFDKVNGNELFFANSAFKTGLFAVRGAWAAIGVEFNFPNSHAATTLDPASCLTRRNDDGSATVVVSAEDLSSRMRWAVETTLRPDSSAVEMVSKLFNPTDLPHRCYYWVNAACPVFSETEFVFPPSTETLLTHPPMDASRLARISYPVHDGVDISRFKNVKQHFPAFAETMREDFFGLYHHSMDYGLAHVADHSLVRGRKLWTFGTARDGRIFIDQLSGSGVDYCELQTGPFSLQSDYRMLWPGRMHVQRESWLPVARTGGFNLACREFSAKIDADPSGASIRLCAAKRLSGASATLVAEGKATASVKFAVEPCRTVELRLSGAFDAILFKDADGMLLATFKTRWEKHSHAMPFAVPSREGHPDIVGRYLEEQGDVKGAEESYAKDSESLSSLMALARIAMERGDLLKAGDLVSRIFLLDRNNAEVLVMRGLVAFQNGKDAEAESAFSRAADDNRMRDTAILHLVRCACAAGDYGRALSMIGESESYGTPNAWVLRLKAFCLEKLGRDPSAAIEMSERLFPATPESEMERVCELTGIRHYADALAIMEAIPDKDACAFYLMAWLARMAREPRRSDGFLGDARRTPWRACFAFRLEMEPALRNALDADGGDCVAAYQLGCLLASKARWTEAAPLWLGVGSRSELYSDSRRNLALWSWRVKGDMLEAASFFKDAIFNGRPSGRRILEAELFFEASGDIETRLKLFEGASALMESDSRVKLAFAKTLLAAGRAEEAHEILSKGNFRLCEGKMLSRRLYEDVCAALADASALKKDYASAAKLYLEAAEYPENIGIGKPSGNKDAQWLFKAGAMFRKLGDEAKAQACFANGSEKGDWLDIDFKPLKDWLWEAPHERIDVAYWRNVRYRARCLEELGRNDDAKVLRLRLADFAAHLAASGRMGEPDADEIVEMARSFD